MNYSTSPPRIGRTTKMAAFKMSGPKMSTGGVAPKVGRNTMSVAPRVGKPVIGGNVKGGAFGVAKVKATVRGGAKGLINR